MPRAPFSLAVLALALSSASAPVAQHAGRFVEVGGQSTPTYSDAVPAAGLRFGYAPRSGFGVEAGVEHVRNRSIRATTKALGHARAVFALRYAFPVSDRLGLDLGLGLRRGLGKYRTLCGYEEPYSDSLCAEEADYLAGGPEAGAALYLSARTSLRAGVGLLSSGDFQRIGGPWAEMGFRVWP